MFHRVYVVFGAGSCQAVLEPGLLSKPIEVVSGIGRRVDLVQRRLDEAASTLSWWIGATVLIVLALVIGGASSAIM